MNVRAFFVLATCLTFAECQQENEDDAPSSSVSSLRGSLLKDYHKMYRPLKNADHNITVYLGMSLVALDLDDEAQRMSMVGSLLITWKDEYLSWTPEDYNGLKRLHFESNDIWLPDIALLNSATRNSLLPSGSLPLVVLNSGQVVWTPPFSSEVPCRMSLYRWPSDTQKCSLKFGSWTHQGDQIDLQRHQFKDNSVSQDRFIQSNRWKLLNSTSARKKTAFDDGMYLEFSFSVRRLGSARVRYVSHTTVAVLVAVLLAYILPMSFHLSRLIIHIFALSVLILCDMMLYISLPSTSGRIPQIVAYYSGTIVLTSMSLVINIVMTTASFMAGPQKLLRKKLNSLLPLSKSVHGIISEEVGYMHLQEEMTTYSDRNSTNNLRNLEDQVEGQPPPQPPPPTERPQPPQTSQPRYSENSVPAITVQRILNGVFFSLFAIAYVIDYSVLVSSVIN